MGERIHLPLYGQLKEHVSFSELKLFNDCQWKWFNLKVVGTEVEDRSFHMDFGKAVHYGMELLYGKSGSVQHATLQATAMYDRFLDTMVGLHPSDLTEALRIRELLPNIFRDCLACEDLQGIRPLKSELQLYESIARTDGLDVKFKGFIDFIFVKRLKTKSVIYIADFKTCQWGWPADKFRDITITSQILLYKHFFCRITGADPKNVTAAYILLKKKPKVISGKGVEPVVYDLAVEVAKIGAGPKAVDAALEYMQRGITEMHRYSYTKNFEACSRTWKDKDTGEQREAHCPLMGTDSCAGPPTDGGSTEPAPVS